MREIAPEVVDLVKEEGGGIFKLCYQCGMCTGACPWNRVTSFSVRRLIHRAQLGVVNFGDEEICRCVGCKLCVQLCPRGVEVPDIMRALRRVTVEVGAGIVPHSLRITAKNIASTGNPLGEPRERRTDWAEDSGVKTFTKRTDILYFACCYQAYDPRYRRVALAAVNILKKADVDFGILGAEQSCCGEGIRKTGHESVYQSLAQNNINIFTKAGAKKILATSPHCYHTLKEEYPEFGGNFEVVHFSQYLVKLIEEGGLKFTKELNKRVTYHDSCYLGRYSGIYDEPRQILRSIPGLELVEMRDSHEYALCCGGGAGGLWQETKKGERLSELRIEQALEVGAQTLAVACPYCMLNLEDSLLTSYESDIIEIKDIVELIQEAI